MRVLVAGNWLSASGADQQPLEAAGDPQAIAAADIGSTCGPGRAAVTALSKPWPTSGTLCSSATASPAVVASGGLTASFDIENTVEEHVSGLSMGPARLEACWSLRGTRHNREPYLERHPDVKCRFT